MSGRSMDLVAGQLRDVRHVQQVGGGPVAYAPLGLVVGQRYQRLAPGFGGIVGRHDPAAIVVGDEHVSGQHAMIEADAEGVWIRDLSSLNGTYLNGVPVTDWVELLPGDVIHFGPVQAYVQTDAASSTGLRGRSYLGLAAFAPGELLFYLILIFGILLLYAVVSG